MIRAPGPDSEAMKFYLAEVRKAQNALDKAIEEAKALPDIEPSKALRITRYNALKREVDRTLRTLDRQTEVWARTEIPRLYQEGFVAGALQMDTGFDFGLVHHEAVDVLVNDAYDDVATRLKTVADGFADAIDGQKSMANLKGQELIRLSGKRGITQQLLTGLDDPGDAARRIRDELFANGVQITDAGGKRWGLETYSRMLVRTKSAMAYNSGSIGKYMEEGVSRVQVFDGVQDDPECARANGQIWSVKYAQQHMLAHPNCRRAFGPVPGVGKVNQMSEAEISVLLAKSAAQGLAVGVSIGAALEAINLYRTFKMTDGVIDLHDTFLVDRLEQLEFELLESQVIAYNVERIEQYLEEIVDPAAARFGMIDPTKRKDLPPDFPIVRARIKAARNAARRQLDQDKIDVGYPAIPDSAPDPRIVNYWNPDRFSDIAEAIEEVAPGVPSAANLAVDIHIAMTDYVYELASAPLKTRTRIAKLLPHPETPRKSLYDFSLESGESLSQIFTDIARSLRQITDDQLRFSASALPRRGSAVADIDDVMRVFDSPRGVRGQANLFRKIREADLELWEQAGLPNPTDITVTLRFTDEWISPLRGKAPHTNGVRWLESGQLDVRNAEPVLRQLFGPENVTLGPVGTNALTFIIRDADGESWFLKWVSGGLNGKANAVIGEKWTDLLAVAFGFPRTPVRVVSGGADNTWFLMPFVGRVHPKPFQTATRSVQQQGLLDFITSYSDGHAAQYLLRILDPETSVLHGIDREFTFGMGGFTIRDPIKDKMGMNPWGGQFLGRVREWVRGEFDEALAYRRWVEPIPWDPPRWTTLDQSTVDDVFGQPLLPSLLVDADGSRILAPGQSVKGYADEFPVWYLTDGQSRAIDDLLSGQLDSDFLDVVDDIDRIGGLDSASRTLSATPEQHAEEVLSNLKARVSWMVDSGILVRSDDSVTKWVDFGDGLTVRLGEQVKFIDFDGVQHQGIVYHMFSNSEGERVIYLLEEFAEPTEQGATHGIRRFLDSDVYQSAKRSEQEIDPGYYFRREQPVTYPPYTTQTDPLYLESAQQRLTITEVYDEYGVFDGYENAIIDVDFTKLDDLELPNGEIVPRQLLEAQIQEIITEELAFIPPAQRPRRIEFVNGLIQNNKMGNYIPNRNSLEISDRVLAGADYERLRQIIRHEFRHSVDFSVQRGNRARLSRQILQDFIDEVAEPGWVWDDLVRAAEEVMRDQPELVNYENALEALVQSRFKKVEWAERMRKSRQIRDFLRTIDEPEEWMRYPLRVLQSDPPFSSSWGADIKNLHLTAEFIAEGLVDIAQQQANGIAARAPRGIDVDTWLGIISNPAATAYLQGGIDQLLDPQVFWTVDDLIRTHPKLFAQIEPGFDMRRVVDQILNVPEKDGGGGATVKVFSGQTPKRGYAVALEEFELDLDVPTGLTDKELEDWLAEEIFEFIEDHDRIVFLLNEDEGWHLGAWYSRDEGKIYLDVSRVEDLDVDAVRFGLNNNQLAFYDLESFEPIWLIDDGKLKYQSVGDYIVQTRPEPFPDSSFLVAPLKGIKKGAPYVFEDSTQPGRHASMGLRHLGENLVEKILRVHRYRWKVGDEVREVTVDLVRTRMETVLRQAAASYLEDAGLREVDRFYDAWLRILTDLSEREGYPSLDRLAAAAATMSPGLDADINLQIATRWAGYVAENRAVRRSEVSRIMEIIRQRADGNPELAKAYKRGSGVFNVRAGDRINDLPPEIAVQVARVFYARDTGGFVPVSAGYSHFYQAMRVLRGDITPDQALGASKVRSFYNNILDPKDLLGFRDITIDFHMADMSLWGVGFGDKKKKLNWESPSEAGVAIGLRGIIAEAAEELWDEGWGAQVQADSLAELQEVLWGTWRRGKALGWWGDLLKITQNS